MPPFDHNRFKIVRQNLGLKQSDCAIGAGLRQNDISRIESGTAKFVPIEYIQYLSMKGVDLNILFNMSIEMPNGQEDREQLVNDKRLPKAATPSGQPPFEPINSRAPSDSVQVLEAKLIGMHHWLADVLGPVLNRPPEAIEGELGMRMREAVGMLLKDRPGVISTPGNVKEKAFD